MEPRAVATGYHTLTSAVAGSVKSPEERNVSRDERDY